MKRENTPRPGVQTASRYADEAPVYDGPSRSQRKRDSLALQSLGETLVTLQPGQLRALALPEPLQEAIEMAQRITSREGRRRQLQLVGKLMRSIDPEPIRDALAKDGSKHREAVGIMHAAEHWRDRLLEEPGAQALLAQTYPGLADPSWRTLIEGARGERTSAQPARRYRELYRALRDLFAAPPATDGAAASPDAAPTE